MKLGIDYGTSNTVVTDIDNNIPLAIKFNHAGISKDVFPSASFYPKGANESSHGLQALEHAFIMEGTLVRSLKRNLKNYYQGLQYASGDFQYEVKNLLINFLKDLRRNITKNLSLSSGEDLEVVLTVPANSNGAQRSITRECFQEAGFIVSSQILEEPTASAIEFSYSGLSDRLRSKGKPIYVLVYDLGGGTFDVSLIRMEPNHFSVIATAGIEKLGGDDFDHCLYEMIIEKKHLTGLSPLQEKLLLHRCCEAKETLANTIDPKYLRVDLEEARISEESVKIQVEEYYECLMPLVHQTLNKIKEVLESKAVRNEGIKGIKDIEKIYLVGGSSQLPLILKYIQKEYGQEKVHLSSLPFASIALGAARKVQQKVQVEQILSRTFGVMRIGKGTEYFSPIFEKGTKIPARKKFEVFPQHNIGYYRYLECTDYANGQAVSPRMWSEILFPYDPEWNLSKIPSKEDIQLKNFHNNKVIEEFSCDENGIISVNLMREIDSLSVRHEIWR